MGIKIIVTVKQVPDTHNVSSEAMTPEGTVNRAALPTIFNPEDLNALEEALRIKEKHGGTITAITMGPPSAIEVLKECLYRGADDVILLSDRKFAGADTLATSYALKKSIEKIGKYDLIICGRQAIDGDTAQVGPQIAEKLNINQLTSVTNVLECTTENIVVERTTEYGREHLSSTFPCLVTVTSETNWPRTPSAKKVMIYKNIDKRIDLEEYIFPEKNKLLHSIKEWNTDSLNANISQCGLSGSPTRVKSIEKVILTTSDMRQIQNTESDIQELINELSSEHIIG